MLSNHNDVFASHGDQEVGNLHYDHAPACFCQYQTLTPNPEQGRISPLRLKDDTGEEEESQTETKLTGEMLLVIKEILTLHQEKGVAFREIAPDL